MAYRAIKVLHETTHATVRRGEMIGPNLAIHRTLVRNEEGVLGDFGKDWTVTLHPSGYGLVYYIPSRTEARNIARRLESATRAWRSAVEDERRYVAVLNGEEE